MGNNVLRYYLIAAIILLCAGCEDATIVNSGTTDTTADPPTTGTGGTTIPPQTPATLRFIASPSTELASSADSKGEGVRLIATALDSRNVVMEGAAVSFSASDGQLFPVRQLTDANGQAEAIITTADNPAFRSFTVTATTGSISKTLTINVVGTTLSIAGPDTVGSGETRTYTVTLLDASGAGIGGQTVQVISANNNTLSLATLTTSPNSGQATFDLTATAAPPDLLTATALGATGTKALTVSGDSFRLIPPVGGSEIFLDDPATPTVESGTITVEWLRNNVPEPGRTIEFSTTRGVVTPASAVTNASGRATFEVSSNNSGPALVAATTQALTKPETKLGVEFIADRPDRMNIQADPAVVPINSDSLITATVRDATDNLVKNQFVDFNITDVSGGILLETSTRTNSLGQATVTYRASDLSSQSNGVRVSGTVRGTAISAFTTFTVGARALRLLLGTGNDLVEDGSPPTRYKLPYSVQVTDSAGDAVPEATFSLKLRGITYAKGFYNSVDIDGTFGDDLWVPQYTAVCANEDLDLDGEMDGNEDNNCNGVLDAGEDADADGVLDQGEDLNGDCILTPSTPASVPFSVELGPEGTGQFDITYPQDRANWAAVELRGIARVSGTETVEAVRFALIPSAEDIFNLTASPPGAISPYGSGTFSTVCRFTNSDGDCLEFVNVPSGGADLNPFDGTVDPDCFTPF
jgi:hypothetical protein